MRNISANPHLTAIAKQSKLGFTARSTMLRRCITFLSHLSLLAVASAVTVATATAEPAFARYYKAEYGYLPSCNACHSGGGGSKLNSYGEQFDQANHSQASFAAIAKLDADQDGFANTAEIIAKANPGDAASTPDKPGNWLDSNALIPIQVRELFPDAPQYKLVDAILTDSEIQRAAALGVTLTANDENIIYVPIINKKAGGTAIIVPGLLPIETTSEAVSKAPKQTSYYLLLTTDRQLAVTQVVPINATPNSALANSPVYATLVGQKTATVPAIADPTKPSTLDEAIMASVKRGLALIEVRLKK